MRHQLTVLLPVRDRAPFTRRWMTYADRVRLPFAVFVADGGADDSVSALLGAPGAFPHVDYQYRRYRPDAQYADFYAKVADALSRIQTPFVALADNDDFVVVEALASCVEFLAAHPGYSACGGPWAWFWLAGSGVRWKAAHDGESLEAAAPSARLLALARWPGTPLYYHVRRTAELRVLFQTIRDANLQDIFLYEQCFAFLTAIAGKTRQLDTVFVARQSNTSESVAGTHAAAHGDWLGRLLAPSWSADFSAFLEATSRALADREGIGDDEARRCVIECYRMAAAPWLLADILREPTVTTGRALTVGWIRRLLAQAPHHPARTLARAIYRRMPWISPDAVIGTELTATRVDSAAADIAPIEAFLTRGSTSPVGRT